MWISARCHRWAALGCVALVLQTVLVVWVIDQRLAQLERVYAVQQQRATADTATPENHTEAAPADDDDSTQDWRPHNAETPPAGDDDSYHQARQMPPVLSKRPLAQTRASTAPHRVDEPHDGGGRLFYLVVSPESNGNRYMVSLLLAAGCYGRADHYQPLDDRRSDRQRWPDHLLAARHWPNDARRARCQALHRSLPHNHVWPRLDVLLGEVRAAGYTPRVLIMLRREDVAVRSQLAQRHVRSAAEAAQNIARAQRHLVEALAADAPHVWFRLVLYEQLHDERYMRWLFSEQLELALPTDYPRFQDRDSKHLLAH